MAPFNRRYYETPPRHSYPNNKERVNRSSRGNGHHTINRRRNNPETRGIMRNDGRNVARGTPNSYSRNRFTGHRSRYPQYDHAENYTTHKTTNTTYKRKLRSDLIDVTNQPNGPLIQGENMFGSPSNIEKQRDAYSSNKRRKINDTNNFTNNNTVTNRQYNCLNNKNILYNNDNGAASKERRYTLSSNNEVINTSNVAEENSIPEKTSKTSRGNQTKEESKRFKIPKKCAVLPSVSEPTEANHIADTPKSLNKNTKNVNDQKDTSSLKTNQIKQFKILLCEISSKIEDGWQLELDSTDLTVEDLGNGEINFTKGTGHNKQYFSYEAKYIISTKSKDTKLNYATFSQSYIKKYFQRYLNFCNNRPSDSLQKFEVSCNIKLNTATFDKQGIDIECQGSNTYKFELQESYKEDIKNLGLYKKCYEVCILPKLAILIADCMNKGHAHFNTNLLKNYFLTFIKEKILEKTEEKEKYILKFHQDFIRGNNLSESAKELRRLLSMRIKLTGGMKFSVSNKTFKEYEQQSVEPLPVEKYDTFHKFLKIFRFKVVDNDIDAMVKSTIGEQFIAIDNDWYLNAVQAELHRILGLEESNLQLFDILKREVHKCNVIKRLQEEPCFQEENIKFEDTGLEQIYQYLTDENENEKVVFCSTKHIAITEHKLRQLSNKIFGYTENEESFFIKDNVLFEITEDVIQGFLSHSIKLLVVLVEKKCTKRHAQLLKILHDIFSTSFSHKDKSAIVVFSAKSEIVLRSNDPKVDDKTLSPLLPESLHQLQQSNVVLHGHGMKIADLMDDAEIVELIEFPEILEQLLSEKLIFEDVLIKPNDLKCYDAELRDETNKLCEVIDIIKCDSQVAIISGESGIGKSFFLYELAQKTCNEYASTLDTHFWLIQINLNKLPFEEFISQDTMNILELFVRYLDLTGFHKKVFIMSAEGKLKLELILVIDGYDGLQSEYKDFALKILKQFKNSSIKKMFIASRNDSIFESGSGVLRYTIEFSVENKKQYCCKYFAESADYIDSLVKELTSTPLHLKMLHEIISNHGQVVPINDSFELYEKYAELKIEVDDINSYRGLSAQRVLSNEDFRLVNFEFQEVNLNFSFPEDLQHVAFYEYFTAWGLSDKFLGKEDFRREILIIANKLVGKTSPIFLSRFLAPLPLNELIDELAQDGLLNLLKVLLSFKDMKKPDIHRVIEKNNTNADEVLKYLFEHYKRTNDCQLVEYINQQVNNETPIQVSCRLRKVNIACELMLLGAEVRFLDRNFLIDMTMFVIRELIKGNSQFENIAEKLLELSPDVLNTHSRQEPGYRELMKYLFERGRKTMIERLLMREPNRKKLLTMRVDGKSPLDWVNKSQRLDNSQRLEMYKYIIENASNELKRENEFFIEPVLRGACETGCDRTFNYFVDRYPENINGFLNTALCKNRLNDVEFVVKISKRKRTIDKESNTLLHRAVKFGTSDEIMDFLITREGLKEVNASKETPLHVAFKTGRKFPTIKYLIEQDSSTIFANDKYGLHPWCYALLDRYRPYDKTEQIEIMDYLLNYKKIEPPGTSSLGSKSDAYKREVMKKLEYFRDPQSYMRHFSLLSSLRTEEQYFCRFMIVHGANVNVTGADGKTPLHVALECKLYELAKLMLQHGAMFDVEDSNNTTPLRQLANSSDRSSECNRMKDILDLASEIFSDGKSLTKYLPVAVKQLKSSRMRHVVNCRDGRGRSLFHLAVLVDDAIAVKNVAALSEICCAKLTDFPKLDVNDCDVDKRTPLELAVSRGLDRVVNELRLLGASSG